MRPKNKLYKILTMFTQGTFKTDTLHTKAGNTTVNCKSSADSWSEYIKPHYDVENYDSILQIKTAKYFDIFLAHNSNDKPAIMQISAALKAKNLKPWLDEEQIPPGRWFQDAIQTVIPQIRSVAVFIGISGVGRWEALEIRAFVSACIERDIPVIPILLPGVSQIPLELIFLRELNWIKIHDDICSVDVLNKLVWGITGNKPDVH